MLLLALPQIYIRVLYLWKFVALDNAWAKDFRPFISFFHSRVFARLAMRNTRGFFCFVFLFFFFCWDPNCGYGAL